jgi:beta-mannosidase
MMPGPSSTLSLFAPLAGPVDTLDGEWRIASAQQGYGFEAGYTALDFDDSRWEAVHLPHLHRSTAAQDTLWYRHHFVAEPPSDGKWVVLCLDGAFYFTQVWLNGVPLGEHEGYFQPFGFDITDLLKSGDNLLAVCCHFPLEAGSFKRKTAIAGIFADWDCKPYPSALYPELPTPYEWTVPLGLWQPVRLQTSGPVLIEALNVFPTVFQPSWSAPVARAQAAELRIVVGLRNLTGTVQSFQVNIAVEPHNFREDGPGRQDGAWPVTLQGGERRQCEFGLSLSQPRLWLPWTHGEPWLYHAKVTLEGPDSAQATQVFGVREIRAVVEPQRWEWWLNGRRIFPKGSNYISDFYLDRVTEEGLRRDLELARGANLDLLRVHAHIAPLDFYRLCDELGLLVMCDFPLIWTYAFNLPTERDTVFQDSVLKQAGEMVELLGSHPSIILWSMHNEPPWTPDGSFLGSDLHQAATNQALDQAAAECVSAFDPTRPVIPASGEFDQHLYYGWYTGSWYDNRKLQPTFPTEFGVQALPNLASLVWTAVNTNWPVDADDPSWAYAGYQSLFWAGPGVGPPAQYGSLAEYVAESQAYQAFYIRYVIEQWRRQKFDPVGGYIHFLFTDGWPGITWSVLDYARLPKAGYEALRAASRPVRLALDLEEGFRVERGFHLVYPEGGCLRVTLYLVNDDYRQRGRVSVRWWLERREEGSLLKTVRRWFRTQSSFIALPAADERARQVKAVEIPLSSAGEYTFFTEVWQGPRMLDENRLDFRVGEERQQQRPSRRVPSWLVNKVYQVGTLRHTGDGFTFGFHRPAVPMIIQRWHELHVDGVIIDPSQVELVCGGVSRQASTITPQAPFEVPPQRRLTVVVQQHPLTPGPHRLEITAELFGFGELSLHIRDRLV